MENCRDPGSMRFQRLHASLRQGTNAPALGSFLPPSRKPRLGIRHPPHARIKTRGGRHYAARTSKVSRYHSSIPKCYHLSRPGTRICLADERGLCARRWGKSSFLKLTQSGRSEGRAQSRLHKPSDHPDGQPANHSPEPWLTPEQLRFQAEQRMPPGQSRGLEAARRSGPSGNTAEQ